MLGTWPTTDSSLGPGSLQTGNRPLTADSCDVDQHSWLKPITIPAIPIKVGAERAGEIDCREK
jgi:hypothetical protein